jgi:hypothetical protein
MYQKSETDFLSALGFCSLFLAFLGVSR